MDYKDYYKVLGVDPQINEDELRSVYKKLAVQFHPDRNPDNPQAEARFKEISEAKEVLLDSDNRRKYDELRQKYLLFQQYQKGGKRPKDPSSTKSGDASREEEFGSVFGNFFQEVFGGRKNSSRRGKNYDANIKISLQEAYKGLSTILKFEGRRLRVRIRPGIEDGQVLKIKGQGQAGLNGGDPGDLYLKVLVDKDDDYVRKGSNLMKTFRVPLTAAVLGRKMQIETLKGKMSINIPAGTQSGQQLKMRGLGMPYYESPEAAGDLFIKIQVIIPRRLSPEEQKLFKELENRGF
ncbi:MAG: J domain-containing protein [Bacteroidia bacterium]|nr:J domain-containing protein [Bacteroidia bacterium]